MKVYVLLVNYLHGGDTSSVDVLGVYAKRKDAISKLMDMESSTIHTYKNVLELTDDQFKSSYGVSQGYEFVHFATNDGNTYDFIELIEKTIL